MADEIHLYGTVGASFWDEDHFTVRDVRHQLARCTGPVTVRINSGGGIATEGQAIYTMLRDYPDDVHVVIDAIAASAASLIAMAGDTITMRLGALMMIHDPGQPWTDGRGTEDDHLNLARGLRTISNAYADIYAARAGITRQAAREIMKGETYYDGAAAVAAGFATDHETSGTEQIAARFDYRIYAHAPARLIDGGAPRRVAKSQLAVLAMLAGIPAPTAKEPTMTKKAKAAGAATEDEDLREDMEVEEETTAEDENSDETKAQDEDETTAMDDDEDEDVTAEDDDEDEDEPEARAQAITALCARLGRPASEADAMIRKGLSAEAAGRKIIRTLMQENPMTGKRSPASPTARITRDERVTRRTGMAAALAAQLTGASRVASVARPYMAMSLVEMAADCIGHRGPLRSTGQKLQVFMDASHSTSDFPAIFENALNKVLLERYQVAEPTYRLVSRRRDFTDFRAHPMVRAGDFPKLQPIAETGEIKFGTLGESRETAILAPFAVGLRITRQMMINDEMGAIDQILGDYGQMIADFEEERFYQFFATAALSDTVAVFHTSRNNLAGTAAAITVASVALGRAAIRKQTTLGGQKMNMAPSILLVGPNKETEAEQLVAAIQPQQAGNVNPFSGRLQVVVTAQIADNAWYLLVGADRPGGACFVHGFLDGGAAPRIRTEETFGTQGVAMTVELDFGLGAIDFRGAYKNPGA